MFKWLFFVIIFLLGVSFAPYLVGHQGYVLIETADYRYELSLITLVIIFIATLGCVYAVEKMVRSFLRLSHSSYSYFAHRKQYQAQRHTFAGLMEAEQGEYKKAQRLIGQSAKYAPHPILSFIKAADIAQKAGDIQQADYYLHQAQKQENKPNLLLDIVSLKIRIAQQKWHDAEQRLNTLLCQGKDNPEVLKLAVDIYCHQQHYALLFPYLEAIKTQRILSPSAYITLEDQVEEAIFTQQRKQGGHTALLTWWHAQGKHYRQNAITQLRFIRHLLEEQGDDDAYPIILAWLKKENIENPALFHVFCQQVCRLRQSNNETLCQKLTKWARTYPTLKGEIERTLGFLFAYRGDIAKASDAFHQALQSSYILSEQDQLMAIWVFEQNGERHQAKALLEQSLRLTPAMTKSSVAFSPLSPCVGQSPQGQ